LTVAGTQDILVIIIVDIRGIYRVRTVNGIIDDAFYPGDRAASVIPPPDHLVILKDRSRYIEIVVIVKIACMQA
jgi:hypothetical protein